MRLFSKKNYTRARPVLRIVLGAILLIIGAGAVAASCVFRFSEWHSLDPSLITEAPRALMIYDSEGELICVDGKEKRIPIRLEELKKVTVDAFVASEDNRFYSHSGIDFYRIIGAAWADLKAGGYVQGASTISQQLIKLSHLSGQKTLDRKLEEAVLATELEKVFTKDEIMEMYLNYIYFGGGFYGIEAASLGYFGLHASELSAAQSAQLAGIIKSPSAYAPHLDPEASLLRRNTVLKLMFENGYIDESLYSSSLEEEPVLINRIPSERNWLTEYSLREAIAVTGLTREELLTGGYSIQLTVDSRINKACEELIFDTSLFPSDNAQCAMVVLDSAGGIAAMIGGRGEYSPGNMNRATDAQRQPGSLIKPILVYAPALEKGTVDAASVLDDEPMDFDGYSPRNSDDKYYGKVTLRTAVAKSLNVPAVAVFKTTGIEESISFAESMGLSFENEDSVLPLALGGFTHGVSPMEMAGAYSALARGGLYVEPFSVQRVVSSDGGIVYEHKYTGRRAISKENSFILTSMLKSAALEGTGKRLSSTGLPLAAKTGTSVDENGIRDAWCAAYTTDYTAVVWMGTDDSGLGSLPNDAVGGNYTAEILVRFFTEIYKDKPCSDFPVPDGVISVFIDESDIGSGAVYLAGEYTPKDSVRKEYFAAGTEPNETNPYWSVPGEPQDVGWSIGEGGFPVIAFWAESPALIYRIVRSQDGSKETVLCEIKGQSGTVNYRDTDVIPGASYTYTITAIHPELKKEDGSPLEGEPSRKLRVVVPFYF